MDVEAAVAEALNAGTPAPAVAALVYRSILPSLVVVQTDNPGEENAFGIGSGVVINSDAEVLTALHIVEDSTEILLVFADGTRSSAAVANADPENDIAVLTPTALPGLVLPATIGNSSAMHVGDEVFAVGHPLGLVGSLSAGVVSGLDRESTPPGREQSLRGTDTVRRRGESGQLGRSAAGPARPGRRYRHRADQPDRSGRLHRHWVRGPHRRGRNGRRRPGAVVGRKVCIRHDR